MMAKQEEIRIIKGTEHPEEFNPIIRKQKEIREGIENLPVMDSETCNYEWCKYWEDNCRKCRADHIIDYLHSQGCVLKVGEITENLAETASQSDTYAAPGKDAFMLSSERTSHIFKAFKDMGYVAVEPLIKEVENGE